MKVLTKSARKSSAVNRSPKAVDASDLALQAYKAKRNFKITAEPSGDDGPKLARQTAAGSKLSFVVQKHWASSLHYDFRLELGGTMKSWAVPKGPSLDTKDKRLAVQVEDHPKAYSSFEGTIPEGQYGAGRVIIWDTGMWTPINGDPHKAYLAGNLKFTLHGEKLGGNWALVRMASDRSKGKQPPWLLIKEKDDFARPAKEFNVVEALPDSVTTASSLKLPSQLKPQLAVLVDKAPEDSAQWTYEIKFDGYRLLTRIDVDGAVRMFTRSGKDWSHKLASLLKEVNRLQLPSGWYDGEIVVNNEHTGRPDFGALQDRMDGSRGDDIVLYLFDLPFCGGKDLRQEPLHKRRRLLEKCLAMAPESTRIRFSQAFEADTSSLMASACKLGLEGIVGKRNDAPYVSRRSPDWIKLKCHQRQEFVVGGYTEPQGSREHLGALLLGVFDNANGLRYAGKVGTGFNAKTLRELAIKLKPLATGKCPFVETVDIEEKVHWLKPILVAEVSFQEWTQAGRLRQAVFHGLRADKAATNVNREAVIAPARGSAPRITHGERVIDSQSGLTKGELVDYYEQVADLLLVHLKDRPTAVLRVPDGLDGKLFFQKHLGSGTFAGIAAMVTASDEEANAMLHISRTQGVLSAAQWNVVEFHTANASKCKWSSPDRMVFDLDPGEGVQWVQIREAALLMRAFLEQLGLQSFLKTSGGNGLHVVVPVRRMHNWATVKGFSKAIVQHMSRQIPQRFVAKSGPSNRVGKIFIDYLRNGEGATTVSAWSARARPGMGISVPVHWYELDQLRSADHWTIRTLKGRLAVGNTPWEGYEKTAHSLTAAMQKLGYKPVI